MIKPVSVKRWIKAQTHEKDFQLRRKLIKFKLGSGKWAYKYVRLLESYTIIKQSSKILDIGCGSDPMICYMDKGERIGLDPLMDVFFKEFDFQRNVSWIKGVGEYLPFRNGCFNVILCMNVLDHMRDPIKALSEISRTIKNGGIFMLYVDCYSPFVKYYRKIKEELGIGDIFHPFSFSAGEILKIMTTFNLHIVYVDKEQTRWSNRLFYHWEKRDIKAIVSIALRAILSLFWRGLAHIMTPLDDDGKFIFIAYKNKAT